MRDERRLKRIFERALWIAVAVPVFIPIACGAQKEGSTSDSAGNAGSSGSAGNAGSSGSAGNAGSAGAGAAAGSAGNGGAAGNSTTGGNGGADCTVHSFTPNPVDTCGDYVRLPCGLPPTVMPAADCYLGLGDCKTFCPGPYFNCHAVNESCVDGGVVNDPMGGVDLDCATCPNGVGRIPAGLSSSAQARCEGAAAVGEYFAAASHLEAASVHAFRRLRAELAAHRAPSRLLRAAGRAQRDEIRHARQTARIAKRFGGVPAKVTLDPVAPRSLDDIAIENAVEGCVRETYGALVATYQAANARDPEIARMMKTIAADETRHAALSWSVARWAFRRLGAGARARLASQCRDAVAGLRKEAASRVPDDLARQAGVPGPAQQRALLDALEAQLWPGLGA